MPPPPPSTWQADTSALLARYEADPVIAPQDARLSPLIGGLTTLSYFGADSRPRVLDQRLDLLPAEGGTLETACTTTSPLAATVAATSGRPTYSPVWLPLSATGGEAPPEASCDAHGAPLNSDGHFCAFGRLALQPHAQSPLIVVVHGLFDSGAQDYVQRMAAELYGLGYSVLIPDMRDHGETLRAAPQIAIGLGALEGPDLLSWVSRARRACGRRIQRAGIVGVSGGGLDAIRAFTLDRAGSLDAGVIALSPLLDVNATITAVADSGECLATRSIELSLLDDVMIAGATGAAFFGGAAFNAALEGRALTADTAIAAGIGAGIGFLTSLAIDAWFDGGSDPCVSEHATAAVVNDLLRLRWRALRAHGNGGLYSPAGQHIAPETITLEAYVRERAQYLAGRTGVALPRFDAQSLANDLHGALRPGFRADAPRARLLVLSAEDDPLTRIEPLYALEERTRDLPQVYARAVSHGGHAALWLVQPAVMLALFERFFGPTGERSAYTAPALSP